MESRAARATQKTSSNPVRKKAFTLFEVTIVIAVLAALAAVVIPRFAALQSGQQSREFTSALMRLGSDARILAIESGQAAQVVYDEAARALVIQTLDPETLQANQERTIPIPESVELSSFTLDGAYTTGGDWRLDFYPDGSGSSAGLEVTDGDLVYNVTFRGRDGTGIRSEGSLEEAPPSEWQAGELEQRI